MGGVTNYKARQNQEKLSVYTEDEKKNRYNLRAVFKLFFKVKIRLTITTYPPI